MFFLVVSLSLTLLPFATAQCYGQSSSSVNADLPCDSGSNPTFCCPASSSCLSIGVCRRSGKLTQASCSDPAFSGTCNQYCPDSGSITSCLPASTGNYCCTTGSTKNGQDKCCQGDTFHLGDLLAASNLDFTKIASSTLSSKQPTSTGKSTLKTTSSSTAKSTGKSSSVSGSTDSSSSTLTTQTASTDSAATNTAAGNQNSQSSSSTPTSTAVAVAGASKGMTTGAKIGAGVGGALGFAFLGFAVFALMFLWRRRRQDKINAIRLSGLRAKAATTRSFSNNSDFTGTSETTGLQQEPLSHYPAPPVYSSQYPKPLPHQPREITSIPESEHLLTPEPAPFDLPLQGPPIVSPRAPPSQRQVYRAYQPPPSPGRIDTHELGFPEVLHNRSSSGPSFSELVTPTSPAANTPPFRTMTPAQELAAARARSNMTPVSQQNARRGEVLQREDSVVSGLSGRSARDRERDRAALSRGNSVVSGRTEYRQGRHEM